MIINNNKFRRKGQEPRRTSLETLFRWIDQGPDSEGSTPGYSSYCEDVPVSGALTTGIFDPAPDTSGPVFKYIHT